MNISNMKIGARLGMGFAVTLALLIVIAVFGSTRISALSEDVELLTSDRFPKTVQANDMVRAINVIARNLRNAALFSGAEQQKALDAIAPQRKIISDNLEKLDKTIRSDKGKDILKKIKDARSAYVADQDKFMELLKAEKKADYLALMQGGLRSTQSNYITAVDELIKFQVNIMDKAGKDAGESAANALRLMIILAAVAGVLAAVLGWLITRSITAPTRKLVEGADKMAIGDFNFKLDIDSKDEVGALANSVRSCLLYTSPSPRD